jgi:hypothetical protein
MYKVILTLMRTIMLTGTFVFTSIVFAQNIIDDGSPAGSTNTPGMTSDVPSIPDTTDTYSPHIDPSTPSNLDTTGTPHSPGTPSHPSAPYSPPNFDTTGTPRSPGTPSNLDSSGALGTKR